MISGLFTPAGSATTGLIPYVINSATIQNVTVANSYFAGTEYVSAVVGLYTANQENATFTMKNVHVEDTIVNTSSQRSAGVLAFVYDFTAKGVSVNMEDVTFVGGSVTAGRMSGGIIGTVNNDQAYENGVALTMKRIVLDTTLTFGISANYDVKSGSLIGNIAGFRSIDITDVFVGGTLTVLMDNNEYNSATAILFGFIKTNKSDGSHLDLTNALLAQTCTNVKAVLFQKQNVDAASAIVKFENVYYDTDVVDESKGCSAVVENPAEHDTIPEITGKSFASMKGTHSSYTGWMVVENDYPIPTARPARLLGWQSTYATDVTANGKTVYSIRLIAALNDTFYTYAGFGAIEIEYKDAQGETVKLDKNDYRCQYVYNSVYGNGNEYKATDYHASYLFALELLEIPKEITEFSITVTPFSGRESVSLSGITRTVRISTATK